MTKTDKTLSVFGQNWHKLEEYGAWVASSALLTPKYRGRRIPEIRVGTDQCPKPANGTMNSIDASEFASSAAVRQQPALLAVGYA